jgi:hypothetical protein
MPLMTVRLRGQSMAEIELSEGSIEAIARRVVELLEERPGEIGLVDAAELARRLGVTRAWVYEHATELGAIRLGDGPSPRLRFDPAEAVAAMRPVQREPPAPMTTRRRSPTGWPPDRPVQLLPIRTPRSVRKSRPPRT